MRRSLKLIGLIILSSGILVGCGVSEEDQAKIDNYPKLEQQVKDLEAKLTEAQPWFEMKEDEQEAMAKEVSAKAEEEQRRLTEGVTVYSDDKVTINYKRASSSGVEFLVENKTDAVVTIQADSVALNGMSSNDIIMSDEVSPKSKGIVKAKCSLGGLGLDFNSITSVSGGLRVIDFNRSFSSYKATFVDVDVN